MRQVIVVAASAPILACSVFSPLWPYTKSPVEHAHELDDRCRSSPEQVGAQVLSPGAVEAIEPEYSHVSSGPADREARLVGARIHVRPLPGLTAESLQRTLECHEARVTLRATPPLTDDPYVLPDRWLAIDVDSQGDGFVARVRADDFEDAQEALERARRFVGGDPGNSGSSGKPGK